jgi:hypothetical protein
MSTNEKQIALARVLAVEPSGFRRGGQCRLGGFVPGRWVDGRLLPRWAPARLVNVRRRRNPLKSRSSARPGRYSARQGAETHRHETRIP